MSPVQSSGEAGHEQLCQSFSLEKQALNLGMSFNRWLKTTKGEFVPQFGCGFSKIMYLHTIGDKRFITSNKDIPSCSSLSR